ncbi:hypothetical protein PR048_000843 [Dryococelus australis]|uniref:Transposase Helix-turn-helix domain-containing protein n=1 Tax=Dryococelus australis TaxID=614101 RepID=A0ABQ9IH03_9NEOP|nr:hypothetical protein PR048_000843 [Dryococelus australis]
MWDDEDVLVSTAAYIVFACKQRRTRRHWASPSLKSRNTYSGTDLMADLVFDNFDELIQWWLKHFFRMPSSDFEQLLSIIGPKIKKGNTSYRQAIPIKELLGVTLRFMASGDSYRSLETAFKISHSTISKCIPEVCGILVEALKGYVQVGYVVCVKLIMSVSCCDEALPDVPGVDTSAPVGVYQGVLHQTGSQAHQVPLSQSHIVVREYFHCYSSLQRPVELAIH